MCEKNIKIIVQNGGIKYRWREYIKKLFDGSQMSGEGDISIKEQEVNLEYMWRFQMMEVEKALEKMKPKKAARWYSHQGL